jgi:hypothetical protein
MEKLKIEVTEFKRHSEEYLPWVIAAGLCLFLEVFLRYTYLKSLPNRDKMFSLNPCKNSSGFMP